VAARRGEGVELRRLQHAEAPGELGPLGLRGEPAPDLVHVALQRLVRGERRGAEQPRGHAAADLDLLLLLDAAGGLAHVLAEVEQPIQVQVELRLRGPAKSARQAKSARRLIRPPWDSPRAAP
jgi:hypothetical protein